MSFNLTYTIEAEALVSQKWQPVEKSLGPFLLAGHSEKREFFIMTTEELRLRVSSERKLKPFEISILNKLPWLKQHYPFRRYSSPIYEWHTSETAK